MFVFQWSGERGDNLFVVNGIGASEHLLVLTSVAVTVARRTGAESFNDAQSLVVWARL